MFIQKEKIVKKLINTEVKSIWIFDKDYVYYNDSQSNLWRVTQDGKTTEKVFG